MTNCGQAHSIAMAALPLLMFFAAGCPVTQSQDTPVAEFRCVEPATGGGYYLYVPSGYDANRPWPLVVTLHGTHGFDDAEAQVREWKALSEQDGFIVLAPQVSSPQGILPVADASMQERLAEDEKQVLAELAEVKRKYTIEPRAVLITGFSAGGYPMYHVGLRHPELFTALSARSCNCDLQDLKAIPMTDAARKMPMQIFFGRSGINPVSSTMNPIAGQSWAAYKFLRDNRCFKAEIKPIDGGHERRPEVALRFWKRFWPKKP